MDSPKYWAFLSYSHRDAKWTGWLHRALESYRPPKTLVGTRTARGAVPRRLAPVFRDREELATATDLGSILRQALADSICQIVVCSPAAAKSRWVNEEILAFKRLGREDRIFCLIVDGEPNATDMPGREDEECFPPALRFHLDAEGNLSDRRTEPIAADARPGKDGKTNAKLKLIAGVLAVNFDLLRRREQTRRNRRLVAIATAASAGMVFASGLAAYALIQRRAAERQAETARQTTNFMIDLFRISDPSEARGNSITAREMLDKGAARIDRELATQPAIRATLLDTVGTTYMGLGLYPQARRLMDGALQARQGKDAKDPLALSLLQQHRGDLLMRQAQYEPAEAAYRQAIALQMARPKDDRDNQIELTKSLHGLGTLLAEKGQYAEADHTLHQALTLQHELYGPSHREIATTLKDLARVMDAAGDLNGAIPVMRYAVTMQRELNHNEPDPALAEAINDLALLLEERGTYEESEKLYREALAMKRRVFGEKHPEVAMGLNNLAAALQDEGDLEHAESTYREALLMQRALLGQVHPDVALTLNNLAFVQSDRGNLRDALATEAEALAVYRKLFTGDHPDVARVLNRMGFWQTEIGDYDQADHNLQEALAMRRRLFGASNPEVASSLIHVAILQVALHHYEAALASARGAVDIFTPALSAKHWKTALAASAEAAALAGLGRSDEAEPMLVSSVAILDKDGFAPAQYHRLAQGYLDELRAGRVHLAHTSRTASSR
ncbi:MAG: tetratricopeptide repeat protein [Proteobacteria bacterium]|nr:tetratricopeptide repeat protein [Pseudomonadota bacterium]